MHVLVLPSAYSDPDRPLCGIFFREQAVEAARACLQIGIAYCEPRSLRGLTLRRLIESHGQHSSVQEGNIVTFRRHAWNPGLRTRVGGYVWSAFTARLVYAYIRRFGRPDLIHVQSALWAGDAARHVKRSLRIPYVVTEHSSLLLDRVSAQKRAADLRRVFTAADGIAAVSGALRDAMVPYTGNAPVRITPNLLTTRFSAPPRRNAAAPGFTYVFVGRLIREKGVHVLLESFARVVGANMPTRLRIVGAGPESDWLRARAVELGIAAQVEFVGEVSRDRVAQLLVDSDAFVLPSFVETFSVATIEALGLGIPVVVTRCGGPSELVSEADGELVAVNDIQDLCQGMERAFHRGFDRNAIQQRAIARFGPEAFRSRLIAFYRAALSHNPASPPDWTVPEKLAE